MSKKNRPTNNNQPSANERRKFTGTSNPRHLRALSVLQNRPLSREELNNAVGCCNSPSLVADLRARGLDLPCMRIRCIDRDGREVPRGVYRVTAADRRKLARWLKRRDAA